MIEAMKKEIAHDSGFISRNEKIASIYFGGGTPSLLSPIELNGLLEVIHRHYQIADKAEITLEANPDDISETLVSSWRSSGINRISLGVQSFHEEELRWMNRSHDALQSMRSIDLLQEGGIYNISADLIFGSPLSDVSKLKKNVELLVHKKIQHLSCYALTVEEKTALHHQIQTKTSPAPDNELQAKHFLILHELLKEAGYEHYEISNYALPGYRSIHNSNYWKRIPYHGFGPSAHGFDGKKTRRWNPSNNALYMSQWNSNAMIYEVEHLTEEQEMNEIIMTSLRTVEGIDLFAFEEKFGNEQTTRLLWNSKNFMFEGKVHHEDKRLRLTVNGMLYADGIAASLFI